MTVHLVGAGPGSVDLLTIGAVQLLRRADVVIHDRLVGREVLDLISPIALRVDVGKDPSGRRVEQEEINRIIIAHGRHGGVVVRLKGGDPFVFGRGGEEAHALRAAGIAVNIVPGVTSAFAAPAVAGIPVTHRGTSAGVTVLTGHEDPTRADHLDWKAAARLGTTLVILMGAAQASRIRSELLDGEMSPDTPVAVITNATLPAQVVTQLTLGELGREPVAAPSVIVIGDVVGESVTALGRAAQHPDSLKSLQECVL